MSTFTNIQKALEKRLNGISTKPPADRIQWTGEDGKKPKLNEIYWRSENRIKSNDTVTIAGLQVHRGIFYVSVFVGKDKGQTQLLSEIDKLYTAFSADPFILQEASTKVYIEKVGVRQTTVSGNYLTAYIEVSYKCYAY